MKFDALHKYQIVRMNVALIDLTVAFNANDAWTIYVEWALNQHNSLETLTATYRARRPFEHTNYGSDRVYHRRALR